MLTQKVAKVAKKFECINCDYFTSKKSDYNKHINTRKHENTYTYLHKSRKKSPNNSYKCECGKEYIHRQSLYKHKSSCLIKNTNVNNDINDIQNDIEIVNNNNNNNNNNDNDNDNNNNT